MNDQLIHILDHSACLSRRQVRDYLAGAMEQEEQHAVELHLIACPLCGLAMEGFESRPADAAVSLAGLNAGFLKEHFDKLVPQIHLNSMSPAHALQSPSRKRSTQSIPAWKHVVLIGSLLAAFAILWYYEFGREKKTDVSSIPAAVPEPKPTVVAPAKAAVEAPVRQHKAKIHPNDEALIREAKAINARQPVELNDDELTKIFDESNALAGQNQSSGIAPSRAAAASGATSQKHVTPENKSGASQHEDSSDKESKKSSTSDPHTAD
jgi:hypothetical protein